SIYSTVFYRNPSHTQNKKSPNPFKSAALFLSSNLTLPVLLKSTVAAGDGGLLEHRDLVDGKAERSI
ncbi:hypothetical protein LINGRAHAP2_LOCUS674, partial [Linum grandiflorum]